jgi:hypothetical protein
MCLRDKRKWMTLALVETTRGTRRDAPLRLLALVALVAAMALPANGMAKASRHAKSKTAAVSRAQKELAQQMVRNAYELGRGLALQRRVELMERLLYTMRPEVMAADKQDWAEELFKLAQRVPVSAAGNADQPGGAAWRNGVMATAAARLAVYDPDRAMELLDTLPAEGGREADARTMAARLVFASYMQRHGIAGAQPLLVYGRKWGEHGGFPYGAITVPLARLRPNDDAAEDFFRQVLTVFERGQEGVFGVSEFAGLLEQAVSMEAISEDSAEEAGRAVVTQVVKLAGGAGSGAGTADGAGQGALPGTDVGGQAQGRLGDEMALTEEQKELVAKALYNVRVSAPKAYELARRDAPGLVALHPAKAVVKDDALKVDVALQAAFRELADAMRQHRNAESLREVIGRALQLVNARYKPGMCAECAAPDAQSWALVSLAAYAAPMTIGTQLSAIEDPFWRAYFLAIAAQQVGEPTRVGDPTARRVAGKEEAEPE